MCMGDVLNQRVRRLRHGRIQERFIPKLVQQMLKLSSEIAIEPVGNRAELITFR